MNDQTTNSGDTRRQFLAATAAGTVGLAFGRSAPLGAAGQAGPPAGRRTTRDRFWLFGVPAGANDTGWGLPRPSRMTPTEGAFYLGVPNVFMITVKGEPPMPFDQYAIPFRALERFAWSLVGSGGRTRPEEREHILEMARRFPNMVGFFMDDFFGRDGSGSLSIEQLKELRGRLVIEGRKRDLYVVLYTHQFELPIGRQLEYCDKITLWTWKSEELGNLEKNFARLEKLAPDKGKLLGLYMWDFGNKGPVPVKLMQKQCELGLGWLRQGRIEGMVFLANTVCDIGLEAVEWSRQWIARVGDQPL